MMQGFYLLAMAQARRRTLLAVLACIAALISIVLAGRALLSAPAVPASAAISYTVQSENDRLVIRRATARSCAPASTHARCHPPSSRHLRTALRSITQRSWRGCWKITARKTPSPFPSPYSVCHRRKKFSCEFCADKALLFLLFVLCCK